MFKYAWDVRWLSVGRARENRTQQDGRMLTLFFFSTENKSILPMKMGCYKITYEFERPQLFLEQGEKNYSLDWHVSKNTSSTFSGAGVKVLTQGDVFGFKNEGLANSYYTKRGDYVGMKTLLSEFLSGTGPERSLFYGSHPLTQSMMNSAVVDRARDYYAEKYPNGGDMALQHFDFYWYDVLTAWSDIEQFVGSARVSIYPRGDYNIFVVDNTTGRYSGSFDSSSDIPRVPGETTPMGNTYQRFIWIEGR